MIQFGAALLLEKVGGRFRALVTVNIVEPARRTRVTVLDLTLSRITPRQPATLTCKQPPHNSQTRAIISMKQSGGRMVGLLKKMVMQTV